MQRTLGLVWGLILALGLGGVVFLAPPANRLAMRILLTNTAAGRPVMAGVHFVVPLAPRPTPTPDDQPYPAGVDYGDDVGLDLYQLGEGYWQTAPFSLVDGRATSEIEDWRAQFRFKRIPPGDPIHASGYYIVGTGGERNQIWFDDLGTGDLAAVHAIPLRGWHGEADAMQAMIGPLQAGEVVALKLLTTAPEEVFTPASAEASASDRLVTTRTTTYAKLLVRKLSQEEVRFDFVYLADGRSKFPTRRLMKEKMHP